MKKRLVSIALTIVFCFCFFIPTFADNSEVYFDGIYCHLSDNDRYDILRFYENGTVIESKSPIKYLPGDTAFSASTAKYIGEYKIDGKHIEARVPYSAMKKYTHDYLGEIDGEKLILDISLPEQKSESKKQEFYFISYVELKEEKSIVPLLERKQKEFETSANIGEITDITEEESIKEETENRSNDNGGKKGDQAEAVEHISEDKTDKSKLEVRVDEVREKRAAEEAEKAEQENTYSVAAGKSLDAKITMGIKYKGKLEWFSSDETVATVSPKGEVRGVNAGNVVITAKSIDDNEVNESIYVSVIVPIKKITLSEKNFEIPVDMTWKLTATFTPENATNQELEWSSSNPKIATVDSEGIVTGKSIGKTKITAVAKDGNGAKTTITLKVDKFDIVIDGMGSVKQTLYTNHFGGEYIKPKTKNKVVDVKLYGTSQSYTSKGIEYGTTFEVTAKKPGTDVITYSYGGSTTKSRVFVSPKYLSDQAELKRMFEEAEAEGQEGIIHVYESEDGTLHRFGEETDTKETDNMDESERSEKIEAAEKAAEEKYHNESRVDSKISFRKIPWGISVKAYLDGDYSRISEYGAGELKDAGVYQIANYDFSEDVAGWPVELAYIWFTKQYDESENIINDEDKSLFYHAVYRIDAGNNVQSVLKDLHNKLESIYGAPSQGNKWEDNGVILELGKMSYSTVTISYTWLEGEKTHKKVEELIKENEKREKEKELDEKSNNINGL